MLVLARGPQDRVLIQCGNKEIVVTVTEIRQGVVRLGFDADRDVTILREELKRNPYIVADK